VSATLLIAFGSQALADGLIRDGIGPISIGRGGTNIGHADNGAVILDNPAGMTNFADQNFFEIGADTVITDLRYSDPENRVRNAIQPFPVPQFAYIRGTEDGNFAFGLGAYAPAGYMATYHMTNPIVGPAEYRSLGIYGKVLPSVAWRITDDLTVGGSFGVGITRTELEGPMFLQTGPLAGTPALFNLKTVSAAPIWSFGLQYDLGDRTRLGAVYVADAHFRTKGDLHSQIVGLGPTPLPVEFDAEFTITWPQSVGVGLTHAFSESHRSSVDVIWYDWHSAFDNMSLRLTNASNPLVSALAGPVLRDSLPLNWDDSISVRVGHEILATENDTLRGGYVYHPSPVPDNTLTPYLDGVLEHAASLGFSHRWETWTLNLAYQFSFAATRHVGTSLLVGGDFDNSAFRAYAHFAAVSLSRSY
jgi:long-chain fatty acid transport protein